MPESTPAAPHYVGRFAPSPTGPLHFGSLLAAIASYLDARAQGGTWLVRMEDLDPPREPAGAAATILEQLDAFGLHWDGSVLYQSTRLDTYAEVLDQLRMQDLVYACTCTRPDVRAMGNVYDGNCRDLDLPFATGSAIRIKTRDVTLAVADAIQGTTTSAPGTDCGDFIIRRKDGLFAYQLAVVVDDDFQGITHIIRGQDLLESTPRQIYLQQVLGYHTPVYGHIPVVVDADGNKLSKQAFAAPIAAAAARELTHAALGLLGQAPPPLSAFANQAELLQWARQHWDIQLVPKLANIRQANLP